MHNIYHTYLCSKNPKNEITYLIMVCADCFWMNAISKPEKKALLYVCRLIQATEPPKHQPRTKVVLPNPTRAAVPSEPLYTWDTLPCVLGFRLAERLGWVRSVGRIIKFKNCSPLFIIVPHHANGLCFQLLCFCMVSLLMWIRRLEP